MRDKQTPGDTYNYKEHVYADPLALRKEIETDKQEEAEKAKVKKYQKPSSPPPVPGGPRKGSSGLYAEVVKKSNIPRSSVRDLGSRFGGTVPRTGRVQTDDDTPPPSLPAVTESRNKLDDSPPGSPINSSNSESLQVPNRLSDEITSSIEGVSGRERGDFEPNLSNLSGDATGEESSLAQNTEQNVSEEPRLETSSPVDEAEVVIDVRINSEAGIEIGAEIPVAAEDTNNNADDDDDDDGGVRLIKSVKRDPFAVENGESAKAKPATAPAGTSSSTTSSSTKPGSETESAGSGSLKRNKKKDVESGLNSAGHLRRNLIILSLFLLIVLILVSAVVVVLVNYSEVFG